MNRRELLKAVAALSPVKSIAVMDVKNDDVIVVECDEPISREGITKITEALHQIWPNRRICVLPKGLTLKVMRGTTNI